MPNRVNMAQGLSTLDPSLSHTHLYKERSRNNHTLHTPSGQPDGIALPYTSPFPRVAHWPACEAGLSAGMQRERVSPQMRKKDDDVHELPLSEMQWMWRRLISRLTKWDRKCIPVMWCMMQSKISISAAYVVIRCLCVCLSRSWVVSKRKNISSIFFRHRVATSHTILFFSCQTA